MQLNINSSSNNEWKKIMKEKLSTAKKFEIHCWNEEEQEIKIALKYGTLMEYPWSYGKVIVGDVTEEFKSFILNQPKPTDTEIYNKMTIFFTINLDNTFWSEHYGTEINEKK